MREKKISLEHTCSSLRKPFKGVGESRLNNGSQINPGTFRRFAFNVSGENGGADGSKLGDFQPVDVKCLIGVARLAETLRMDCGEDGFIFGYV